MNKPTTKSTDSACNIIILSVTIIFIVSTVIVGLCVRFLVDGRPQQVILIVLICVLGSFGLSVLTLLEIRRRRAINIKKRTTKNGNYSLAPSAPPISSGSGWNYSARSTVRA